MCEQCVSRAVDFFLKTVGYKLPKILKCQVDLHETSYSCTLAKWRVSGCDPGLSFDVIQLKFH